MTKLAAREPSQNQRSVGYTSPTPRAGPHGPGPDTGTPGHCRQRGPGMWQGTRDQRETGSHTVTCHLPLLPSSVWCLIPGFILTETSACATHTHARDQRPLACRPPLRPRGQPRRRCRLQMAVRAVGSSSE